MSIWQKMNNLPKHHGAGPNAAASLHRLKAGPGLAALPATDVCVQQSHAAKRLLP